MIHYNVSTCYQLWDYKLWFQKTLIANKLELNNFEFILVLKI